MGEPITREEFHRGIDSVRQEFRAEVQAAGIQIGAVEKILTEKLKSVKVWIGMALLAGQTAASIVAAYVGPGKAASSTARAVGNLLGF